MSSQSKIIDLDVIEAQYTQFVGKRYLFLLVLALITVALAGTAVTLGVIKLSIGQVYEVILHNYLPDHFQVTEEAHRVVWNIRLPRILFGILAGMGLGIAGAVMQVVLKNPLASPYTLGISSAAGFGAAVAILLGQGFFGSYLIAGNAFVFALLSSMVIVAIARHKGATPEIMVLSGIAIMYFFSACTTLLEYFADSDAVKGVVFWMVGSLSKASWNELYVLCFVLAVCIPILVWKSWDFNVMSSGDETAKSLGIDVDRTRNLSMIISSLIVASIVAFTGTIGFIGLVAPHIARMIVGGDNKFVLPGSALVGGLLLAGADVVAQHIMPPVILPIGVMTAFMGIPLFFYLIMRRRKGYW
jgi:iron complex transport system permease protein